MKVIKQLNEILENDIAITIGNFDGVHKGHRTILSDIKSKCVSNSLKLVVVTFTPHPVQILNPKEHYLINSYHERRELLSEIGIDYILEIEFNRDLSMLEPEEFLNRYIFKDKNIKEFYLGHDFAFGAQKKGDHTFVNEYCKDNDTNVIVLKPHSNEGDLVSSTIVRKALRDGDIKHVAKLLGREYYIRGHVIKGAGRGKQIGVPTANLALDRHRCYPKKGVYITRAKIGNSTWHAVTNIGNNPTFNDGVDVFIETHILDFDNDIYGNEIEVTFVKRLRGEVKFESVNDLIKQIKKDVAMAREYFND